MNNLKPLPALMCLFVLSVPHFASADTAAERDKRRTGYMEGFVCDMYIHGQLGHMKWLANGNGELLIPQHSDSLEWIIKNDKYCIEFSEGNEHCVDFPQKTLANEEEEFEKWMKRDCLFN